MNARVVAASPQMAFVDYDVGQWSSSVQSPPPLAGLFDLAVCEWLLLEPSAWGRPKRDVCVHVCVCVCMCCPEGRNDVTAPYCTIGLVDDS